MSPQNSPLHDMRSIVTTYDRLVDDPQARETYLGLMGIDCGMVALYRQALHDAEARPRRSRRSSTICRNVNNVTVTFTVW